MRVPDALVGGWTLCLLTKERFEIRLNLPCDGSEFRDPFSHCDLCMYAQGRASTLTKAGDSGLSSPIGHDVWFTELVISSIIYRNRPQVIGATDKVRD